MKKLTLLSVAALLAASTFAMAQSGSGGMAPGNNMAAQGKCWDAASNTVKDKATQSASGQKQDGALTTGAGTSGNAANSSGSRLQTRPAGMPSC